MPDEKLDLTFYVNEAMDHLGNGDVHKAVNTLGQKAQLNYVWRTAEDRGQTIAKAIFAAMDTVPDSCGLDNKAEFLLQMAGLANVNKENPELANYIYSHALNIYERILEEGDQGSINNELIEGKMWWLSMCVGTNNPTHDRAATLFAASVRDRSRTDLQGAFDSVNSIITVTDSPCSIKTQAQNLKEELGTELSASLA